MSISDKVLCSKCGKDEVLSYHDAASALCPECCDDHDYEYDRCDRVYYCTHCGQEPPDDWYYSDDDVGFGSISTGPAEIVGTPLSALNGNAAAASRDPDRWANWVACCERNGIP